MARHLRTLGQNKGANILIAGIEEGEEIQVKGKESIFNKIVEENCKILFY